MNQTPISTKFFAVFIATLLAGSILAAPRLANLTEPSALTIMVPVSAKQLAGASNYVARLNRGKPAGSQITATAILNQTLTNSLRRFDGLASLTNAPAAPRTNAVARPPRAPRPK